MAIGGKPFSLQAPEQIAKEYGGDKQRIMQAAQMGIVDPTAALMAGMFIDRIRTAQVSEQAAPSTVAQDVFTPPAPPAPQMPAGLGATPPTGAPAGLDALPVSEGMFPEEQPGMAGGGLVAFQSGGALGPWFEEQATSAVPGVRVTSGLRTPARNAAVGGTPNSYHLTNNARDFVPPQGMSMAQLAQQLGATFGAGYDIINEGDHVHVEPGGGSGRAAPRSSGGAASFGGAAPLSVAEFSQLVAAPEGLGVRGNIEQMQRVFADYLPDTSGIEELMADLRDRNTPEAAKAQREQDLWSALAEFGFRWASSGRLAESAGETFSGLRETLDARRDEEMENLSRIIQLEGMQIERAMPAVEAGIAAANQESAAQAAAKAAVADYAARLGLTTAELAARLQMSEAELAVQMEMAIMEDRRTRQGNIMDLLAALGRPPANTNQTQGLEASLNMSGGAGTTSTPAGWGQATVVNP